MQNDATQELIQSQGYSITFLKRFWGYVQKPTDPEACWVWTGFRKKAGYGAIGTGPIHKWEKVGAHRVSWILHNGKPIPKGLHVCHHCDNPPCVNPSHLFLGTMSENMRDKTLKLRGRGPSKLSKDQVREILELLKTTRQGVIALKYGVHSSVVSRIHCWRRYKYISR